MRTVIDVTGVLARLGVGTERIQVNGSRTGRGKRERVARPLITVEVYGWPPIRALA